VHSAIRSGNNHDQNLWNHVTRVAQVVVGLEFVDDESKSKCTRRLRPWSNRGRRVLLTGTSFRRTAAAVIERPLQPQLLKLAFSHLAWPGDRKLFSSVPWIIIDPVESVARGIHRRSMAAASTPRRRMRSSMSDVPRVFISATSRDLGSCRKAVSDVLLTLNALPVLQDHFAPDYRTVVEMLRARIETCDAVICLVGRVYGQEPLTRSADQPRRSYTQLEYEIAEGRKGT
jgi:hypothetical protein